MASSTRAIQRRAASTRWRPNQSNRPRRRALGRFESWPGGRNYLEDRFIASDLLMTNVMRILRHRDIVSRRPAHLRGGANKLASLPRRVRYFQFRRSPFENVALGPQSRTPQAVMRCGSDGFMRCSARNGFYDGASIDKKRDGHARPNAGSARAHRPRSEIGFREARAHHNIR
jgi:hypothetical protein